MMAIIIIGLISALMAVAGDWLLKHYKVGGWMGLTFGDVFDWINNKLKGK